MVIQRRICYNGVCLYKLSCGSVTKLSHLTAFLDASGSIARRLIAHARERADQGKARLMRDIRIYLEENATDVNIGLTAVAETFHITPRDAAEMFREMATVGVGMAAQRGWKPRLQTEGEDDPVIGFFSSDQLSLYSILYQPQ